MKKLLLITLFASFSVNAFTQKFEFNTYEEAEKAKNYLRFDMESTKVGIITTSFTGFVKKFHISGVTDKLGAENVEIKFLVKSMDTDSDGRNEKMWNYCLDLKNNPEIIIKFPRKIFANKTSYVAEPAWITLRGKDHQINVTFTYSKDNQHMLISGTSQLSIKKLKIPDPSITVASVDDTINVSFKIRLKNLILEEKVSLQENRLEVQNGY